MLENVEMVVFGAHPDDVEIACGGLIAKAVCNNIPVGIADLTRGEMASTGTPEQRLKEASAAARLLGVKWRHNLGIPDRNIALTDSNLLEVVKIIRQGRPQIVLAPFWEDRHPDHVNCSKLVAEAFFAAGLWKYCPEFEPHRPRYLYYYLLNDYHVAPSFIVDISAFYEQKKQAIMLHASQFAANPERPTPLNNGNFLTNLDRRNGYFGSLIGVAFGEPYISREVLAFDPLASIDLIKLKTHNSKFKTNF